MSFPKFKPEPKTDSGVESLSKTDEQKILAWLFSIQEFDSEIIAETIERCRTDPDVKRYFLKRAHEG